MIIHVYSIVRNDSYILPYFLRHYSTFADKIFIFDDHSTDDTREIASRTPNVECLPFEYNRGMNEEDFNDCFEKSYKKYSRGVADWVICVDSDELIYSPNIKEALAGHRERGHQILKSTGYMMVSEKLPSCTGQIYEESNLGVKFPGYDKPVIFDPSLDIKFGEGRHSVTPPKGVKIEKAEILLLHYRYLSRDYFIKRSEVLYERIGMDDSMKKYRMTRGLDWYDRHLRSKLTKVL